MIFGFFAKSVYKKTFLQHINILFIYSGELSRAGERESSRAGEMVREVEKEYQRNCLKMFSFSQRRDTRDKSSSESSKADKLKLVCDICMYMP